MDKNLDFEKLVEQAKFLTQLLSSGTNNKGETECETDGQNDPSDVGIDYTGAFSSGDSDVPVPDAADNQEAIEKAIQAIKIFQSLNQSDTSDKTPAYDNTSEQYEFTEDNAREAERDERDDGLKADYSRLYDETFSTPNIKAIKSAIRFVDSRYHKPLGIWLKFLEMQNMLEFYAKRAENGHSRPEHADWRRGMLLSIRPYVSSEKQYTIDFLVKVLELKEIVSIMGEMDSGG